MFPSKPSPICRAAPHRTAPHRAAPRRAATPRDHHPPVRPVNTEISAFNGILETLADMCDYGMVHGPLSPDWDWKLLAKDSAERRKFQDNLFAAVENMDCEAFVQVKAKSSLKRLALREEKKVSALHSISHHVAAPSRPTTTHPRSFPSILMTACQGGRGRAGDQGEQGGGRHYFAGGTVQHGDSGARF